jgi:AcrR family transcriptional regulator
MIRRPNLLAGEDLPPEPRQQRSLDKRARIKEAGLALFGTEGYEGTSIDAVARRANLAVGGCYQHFRSKRQLLLTLMDDLLQRLNELDLQPVGTPNLRAGLRDVLARAFAQDLTYLGAYRAWQEAALADPDLARKQRAIHAWTSGRVAGVLEWLHHQPGARRKVDIPSLARAMDLFFWSLLAQASRLSRAELDQWLDAATHLMYHAVCSDVAEQSRRK